PRYLAALEEERASWWSCENFDTWKNLYVSEYARGFSVIEVLRAYADFNPGTAHVLDIGCGDAGTLIAMAEQGAVAAGLEVDPKSLRRAALRAGEHGVTLDLREGVAEELPFPDRTFDLVLLDNVLEHVGDQAKTLG